jgi:hypothetical protein
MPNPLHLNEDELDALRALHTGSDELEMDDPIWQQLEDRGLVVLRNVMRSADGSLTRIATLTTSGRGYPTS